MTNLDGIAGLKALLSATGSPFVAVVGPDSADIAGALKEYPRCAVNLVDWQQDDQWDPVETVQRVRYELEITTRPAAGDDPEAQLDDIVEWVKDALNETTVGDGCIPALCGLDRGAYLKFGGSGGTKGLETAAAPNERRIWIFGHFGYYQ